MQGWRRYVSTSRSLLLLNRSLLTRGAFLRVRTGSCTCGCRTSGTQDTLMTQVRHTWLKKQMVCHSWLKPTLVTQGWSPPEQTNSQSIGLFLPRPSPRPLSRIPACTFPPPPPPPLPTPPPPPPPPRLRHMRDRRNFAKFPYIVTL
jgi:hypothetical protein